MPYFFGRLNNNVRAPPLSLEQFADLRSPHNCGEIWLHLNKQVNIAVAALAAGPDDATRIDDSTILRTISCIMASSTDVRCSCFNSELLIAAIS